MAVKHFNVFTAVGPADKILAFKTDLLAADVGGHEKQTLDLPTMVSFRESVGGLMSDQKLSAWIRGVPRPYRGVLVKAEHLLEYSISFESFIADKEVLNKIGVTEAAFRKAEMMNDEIEDGAHPDAWGLAVAKFVGK